MGRIILTYSCNSQDTMVLAEEQAHKSMKWNRETRKRFMKICLTDSFVFLMTTLLRYILHTMKVILLNLNICFLRILHKYTKVTTIFLKQIFHHYQKKLHTQLVVTPDHFLSSIPKNPSLFWSL